MEYRTGRHCVFNIHAHLVFVTKYRSGCLDAAAIANLDASFRKVAGRFGAEVSECNGEADHVHLLVNYPPTVSLSRLVNSLKGVGSRILLRDRQDLRRHCAKGLWSPSYFAASCGGAPLETIKSYIQDQRTPAA